MNAPILPPEPPRPHLVAPSTRPLTARQASILDYLRAFIAENGHPPTLREIGRHFGIKSSNGVHDNLRALERKGYIAIAPEKARGIVLLDPATGAPATIVTTSDGLAAEVVRLRELARRCQEVLAKQIAISLEIESALEEINAELAMREGR
jgi:SOS-response transcriptional repressor LexA